MGLKSHTWAPLITCVPTNGGNAKKKEPSKPVLSGEILILSD